MKFIGKYKRYFLVFLIPLLIFSFVFFIQGDFGKKSILNGDMQSQYLSLFEYLRDVLHGEASFPYSFSKGLGGGMYGTYFYYLASPLNFLVYFFENVPLFLTFLVLFKLSLCGFTMYIFLSHKFKDDNTSLIFALAYAFMTYNVNYYTNVMWLDGVILAPLLLLGIDRIIEKKGNLLYIIILALVIYLNYYIGYILVLFSVIYFLYSLFNKYQKRWREEYKQIINFGIVTVLTGLSMTFILLPSAIEMLEASRVNSISDIKLINFNFLDLISAAYIGFGDVRYPLNYNGFCAYAGTALIPLIVCYFASPKFSKYEKKLTMIVYVLFFLPVFLPILNMGWHMFSVPNGFNYRYSFLVTLFSLIIAYRAFNNLKYSKALVYYLALFVIFSISIGYSVIRNPEYYYVLDVYKIIVTLLFTIINIILIYKNKKVLILILLCIDLMVNLLWIWSAGFSMSYKGYNLAKEDIHKFALKCGDYRCESVSEYTNSNDSFFGGYKGESMFLSTINKDLTSFLAISSDISVYRNYYTYHPDVILDMLLGVKLIKAEMPIEGYEVISKDDYNLYWLNNPNALSLGYTVSSKVKNFKSEKKGFFFLEDVLDYLDDEKRDYIKELPILKVSDTEYKLNKEGKYPYLYLYTGNDENLSAKINGKEAKNVLFNGKHYAAIYDNYGKEMNFTFNKKVSDFKVYTVNLDCIESFRKNREEMILDKNSGNYIRGHITSSYDAVLMTSISYDEGFDVYINGKRVNSYKVLNSFLAFDIPKGYSKIEIKYHVYGFKLGLIISFISLILLIVYEVRKRKFII